MKPNTRIGDVEWENSSNHNEPINIAYYGASMLCSISGQ